mmetsp:Transcript_15393/g.21447  ORF Transcript_15393/g.21447 Transcript_15393/m.21447 type:complete len:193 (+) Transcript_15393:84-662(+)
MTKQKPLCPCCRQTFINVPYDEQAIPTSTRTSSLPSSSSQDLTLPPPIALETVSAHTDVHSSEDERITNDDDDVVRVVVRENENDENHEASDTITVKTDVESSENERISDDGDDNDDASRVVVHENENNGTDEAATVEDSESIGNNDDGGGNDVEDGMRLATTEREQIGSQDDNDGTVNSASLSPPMVKEAI